MTETLESHDLASEPTPNGRAPGDSVLRLALVWNDRVVSEVTHARPRDVTIGEDPGNTFVIPAPELPPRFTLFTASRDKRAPGYTLHVPGWAGGRLSRNSASLSVAQWRATAVASASLEARGDRGPAVHRGPVGGDDRGLLTLGELAIFWQFVPRAEALRSRGVAIERELLLIAASVHVVTGSAIVAAYLLHEPALRAPDPHSARVPRFLLQRPSTPPRPAESKRERRIVDRSQRPAASRRHLGREGRAGEPDRPRRETRAPRTQIAEKVASLGALGALDQSKLGGPLDRILREDSAVFAERVGAAARGSSDELALGDGIHAWGTRGTERGGGGDHWGRVGGRRRIDTGGGSGAGERPRLRAPRERRVVAKSAPKPDALHGFCSATAIARVVRNHQGGLRFCFERELQTDPKLAGKVVLRWRIDSGGRVRFAQAASTTIGRRRMEDCLLANARRWIFPKPQDGECVVEYPFVFKGGL